MPVGALIRLLGQLGLLAVTVDQALQAVQNIRSTMAPGDPMGSRCGCGSQISQGNRCHMPPPREYDPDCDPYYAE